MPWHRTSVEYPNEFEVLDMEGRGGLTLNQWVAERGHHDVNVAYRADGDDEGWMPSIFMPRWASRINLEIIKVRVERVTDIDTPGDCFAEGIPSQGGNSSEGPTAMKMKFAELWDSINEKRGFAWYTNPWVWVVEFKSLVK